MKSREVFAAILIVFIFSSSASFAEMCSSAPHPFGFGLATLEQSTKEISSVDPIKEKCQKHRDIFSDFKNQKSDVEVMNKSIAKSQVTILAEEHGNPSQRDYGKLFTELKKQNPKIDCLFLEWNAKDPQVQKLLNGEVPESLNYAQHTELIAAAHMAQTKIFAVDNRDKNTVFDSAKASEYVRNSNLGISKNIKQLFDSGSCKAGVLVIGKAHVETPLSGIVKTNDSVKTMLEGIPLSVTAIDLIYSGKNVYAETTDEQWSWGFCKDQSFALLQKQIAVSKERLNCTEGMVEAPVNIMDYYLFLPEVDSKRVFDLKFGVPVNSK